MGTVPFGPAHVPFDTTEAKCTLWKAVKVVSDILVISQAEGL